MRPEDKFESNWLVKEILNNKKLLANMSGAFLYAKTLKLIIMKHIYYAMIIFPLIWEMMSINSPKKVFFFIQRMKLVKDFDNYNDREKLDSFFTILYIIWTLIGLASFQWPMFGLILLISFIPKKHWIITWLDAIVTFCILVFVFINAYHLNIDVFQVIRDYFRD